MSVSMERLDPRVTNDQTRPEVIAMPVTESPGRVVTDRTQTNLSASSLGERTALITRGTNDGDLKRLFMHRHVTIAIIAIGALGLLSVVTTLGLLLDLKIGVRTANFVGFASAGVAFGALMIYMVAWTIFVFIDRCECLQH